MLTGQVRVLTRQHQGQARHNAQLLPEPNAPRSPKKLYRQRSQPGAQKRAQVQHHVKQCHPRLPILEFGASSEIAGRTANPVLEETSALRTAKRPAAQQLPDARDACQNA